MWARNSPAGGGEALPRGKGSESLGPAGAVARAAGKRGHLRCDGAHGGREALAQLLELAERAPGWEPLPPEKDEFLSSFHTLAEFAEEEVSWLVEGWLPEGQITLLAADGGTGKTTLWCNLIAALSSGKPCLLDPPGTERTPARVAFFSTEDSVTKKLKRQLRESGQTRTM